ncbi:DUF1254 domain-containing protein [Rhizobium leguminosarum]|uniref:DUF1254 domain-containing protein n=1 Tax=Rhizobium leguminosarum TaxID=384 RepID=UPI001C919A1D|nr:DUF1254 domain-containing protein [Rhizobium leguminosarum]MBY3027090.1 DUF1254 domain-containing protein [Rhizobium leguminosarum]
MLTRRKLLQSAALGVVSAVALTPGPATAISDVTSEQARAIAKEAYIWGYALVDDHRIQYSYFIDTTNPEYKGPWNTIGHNTRLYTPADTTIQTINSDTLYSFIGMDVRDEPIVISVPDVDPARYYGCSLFDLWGHCDMFGTRTTGNDAASFMVAGPGWKGETPANIKKVFNMETTLGSAAIRTQLFNPGDIENVKKVQSGFKVQTLSAFLGRPAPTQTKVNFIKPLTVAEQKSSLLFFNVLNNLLQFAPTHPTEAELKARVAKIGIGEGKIFDPASQSPEMKAAIEQGMADAWVDISATAKKLDTGEITPGDCYGTRAYLKNNYLYQTTAIYLAGNAQPKEEVIYPFVALDSDGKPLTGKNHYTIRFAGDKLPPAKQFWSITMYNLPQRLLVANPIDRYLLNTPMMPNWAKDADGGYTFYIQKVSPGPDKEANWLPTPEGPFYMVMRLYLPSKEAQDGLWKAPKPERLS